MYLSNVDLEMPFHEVDELILVVAINSLLLSVHKVETIQATTLSNKVALRFSL